MLCAFKFHHFNETMGATFYAVWLPPLLVLPFKTNRWVGEIKPWKRVRVGLRLRP